MRKLLFALSALAAGCTLASSAPAVAAARNYDCSKPGNANKAACKNAAAKPAKAAPAPKAKETKAKETKAKETKAKETKATASKTSKTKAAEAPKPATTAKPAGKPAVKPAATSERHYDCSKAGNANKAVCKGAGASVPTVAAKPAPAGKPAPRATATQKAAPAPKAAPAATSSENNIAAGAIAQCKDGTYSHAKNHRGACSRHGGVAKWLA
jgi:hypothetical protein